MVTKNKTPAEVEAVTITMSRETAQAVKQACEEYLRFRMGQFEDFTNEVCCWDYVDKMEKRCHTTEERKQFHKDHEADFLKCMRLRNQMRQGMDALWKQNVPPASIDTTMKGAYRAETVWLTIRYALAWHDFPEGGQWVDFYEPMNRSDQPMPKVELKLKGEENDDHNIPGRSFRPAGNTGRTGAVHFRGDGGSNLAKIQKSGRGNPGGNGETKGYCGDDTGFAKEEANAQKESGKRK